MEQQQREDGTAPNPYGMLGETKDWINAKIARIKAKARRGSSGSAEGEGAETEVEEEEEDQKQVKGGLTWPL